MPSAGQHNCVSRIDSAIDGYIKGDPALESLSGKVAIANAKLAYQRYLHIFSGPKWEALEARGAMTQRVLWASTSTKSAKMKDVVYVEELIGPDTVNTIPPATLDAFRDHGEARASLESGIEEAKEVMAKLAAAGISIDKVTADLVTQGVKLFAEPFDKLLNTVDPKCKLPLGPVSSLNYSLAFEDANALKDALEAWSIAGKTRRLWAKDASLWTGTDEAKWLGWLGIADLQLQQRLQFENIAKDVKAGGFTDVSCCSAWESGSSLCVEVLETHLWRTTRLPQSSRPRLDRPRADPRHRIRNRRRQNAVHRFQQIRIHSGAEHLQAIFLRPRRWQREAVLRRHRPRLQDAAGRGRRQIPRRLRRPALATSIGGRYSALSDFGIVPGAAMGIDTTKLLEGASNMALACSSCASAEKNPGVLLGVLLGTLAKGGRDKVTIVASPGIHDLGAWLEQLLAESTGKDGKGLIPVDREALGGPEAYGKDRVFVYLRMDATHDDAVEKLSEAGQPVVRIEIADAYGLGQEFFRWEFATAVAGSILGINAFNQPDVEASKIATKKLTTEYEEKGSLPAETPALVDGDIAVYGATDAKSLEDALRGHLNTLKPGDYFALLGYIQMNDQHEAALQSIRIGVRDKKKVATCLGFGPRFLHSTGQAYKGGPNTGVFLQITADDAQDLEVPGQKYTFGIVKAAQARGDLQVLVERGRRALRIHLGKNVEAGLAKLASAMGRAVQ